jgi:hypothetical protein
METSLGITTPLSEAYEQEIPRRVQAFDLNDAIRKILGRLYSSS